MKLYQITIRTALYISFLLVIGMFSFTNKNIQSASFYQLKYDVEIQDKYVGWMTCLKNVNPSQPTETNFVIDSKVNVNVITDYDIQFKLESGYKNGSLANANYFTKVNGDTQSLSSVKWDGTQYWGWDGKKKTTLGSDKIMQSIGNLYFKEPVGLTQLFSEKYLAFCPITKAGEYYTVSFPDGKSTIYKYQNGICVWAESKQKLYKIVFRLKEIK